MEYVIHFFTSEEATGVDFAIESSKLSFSQLSDFELVRALKWMVGQDEHIPDSTYALPIIPEWKNKFVSLIQGWAAFCPKLNEAVAFISKLQEGRYLGVSFNESLDVLEKKKLLFEMQEREGGLPAKERYEEYLRQNESLFHIYQPHSYSYNNRIRFGTSDRKLRVCRYCGKRMPDTTFKNTSHTISNCLGNISFITNDECDNCNTSFGKGIEQEFANYISIYRTLAARYEGHPFYTTQTGSFRLGVDKETNRINFCIKDESKTKMRLTDGKAEFIVDGGYINFHNVYRALVKYVIGMLPPEQLPFFKETIKWVNGENNISHLPIIKETVYDEPESHPFLNMFFRKKESIQYPYLIADFHVNHLEFLYVVPGCQQDKTKLDDNILVNFLKLKNDSNQWRNIFMNLPQPRHMKFTVTYYMNKNEVEH